MSMDENDKKFSPPLIFLFIMFSHSLNGLCSPTGRLFIILAILYFPKLVRIDIKLIYLIKCNDRRQFIVFLYRNKRVSNRE